MQTHCEIAAHASFQEIRYAQCWEDADVLLAALDPGPDDTCLSVASAGDNTLALAGCGAGRVIAVDLSDAQIACLELRIAAYRNLDYDEFLQFAGQSRCADRLALYRRCRDELPAQSADFWDANLRLIEGGFARAGKFERYLATFRRRMLPLVQRREDIDRLLLAGSRSVRSELFSRRWDNWRWRLLCRFAFSPAMLGRFGRDRAFTRFADEPVASSLARRIPHALIELAPRNNPYLQWILTGRYRTALPWAWRRENYERIRANLDAIEIRCQSIEAVVADLEPGELTRCNLSNIFEYMSETGSEKLLQAITDVAAADCRILYWNLVVPRQRPQSLAHAIRPQRKLATTLHRKDKAFFYRDLVIEEVC